MNPYVADIVVGALSLTCAGLAAPYVWNRAVRRKGTAKSKASAVAQLARTSCDDCEAIEVLNERLDGLDERLTHTEKWQVHIQRQTEKLISETGEIKGKTSAILTMLEKGH